MVELSVPDRVESGDDAYAEKESCCSRVGEVWVFVFVCQLIVGRCIERREGGGIHSELVAEEHMEECGLFGRRLKVGL